MASISSAGIGSGLDVAGIVSKLMAVEQQPIEAIDTKEASYNTQISAYGTLKSLLSNVQTAAEAFSTAKKMLALTGSVADSAVASVNVTSSASPSSYALEVTSLASSQKLATGAFASSSTSLGSAAGSLTIEFGSVDSGGGFTVNGDRSAVTVDVTADQMTPAGVRDAINAANVGVTATLLNDGTGTRIVLTNSTTGENQSMRITVSDPDGDNTDASGLSALAYDPAGSSGAGKNMTQLAAAADAAYSLDGIAMTSSTNTISNVVDGVTLTLTKTNAGSPTTLTVAQDDTAIKNTINSFVTAYNSLATQLAALTKYDASTKTAGTLQGDSTTISIQRQLRNLVTSTFASSSGSSSVTHLADIGLTLQTDGTLKLDETRFSAVFASNRDDVVNLFTKDASGTSGNGFAGQMDKLIDHFIGIDGMLTQRTDGIADSISDLEKQRDRVNARLDMIQARYERQFSALDVTVSTANSLAAYLTQQLDNLPGASSSSK